MNDQLKAIAAPSGALEVAEQLALLHAAALDPKTVGEATFVMIPSGFTHQDVTAAIEKAQNAPTASAERSHSRTSRPSSTT
jgi:hypothetical protein